MTCESVCERSIESAQRVGGRHGALLVVFAVLGAGFGWPTPHSIAMMMGWRSPRSARDALARLERDGLIRRAGRSAAGRRQLWEVTDKGTGPISAWAFTPTPRKVSDGTTSMNGPDNGLDAATSLSGTSPIIGRAA